MTGALFPTTTAVAIAWLSQRVPTVTEDMVATSLPSDPTKWAARGFLQVSTVGGQYDIDTYRRSPMIQLDAWAVNVGASGAVSSRPAWGEANELVELVRAATEDAQLYGLPVELPERYRPVRVLGVRLEGEPRQVTDDPAGYARFSVDLVLDWVAQ